MIQAPTLKTLLVKVVIVLLPFFVVGFFSEHVYLSLFIGTICILLWNYYHLVKLINWLWHKRDAYPPRSKGVWADVFDAIYHQQRKHRKKRNELSVLVRRFRLGAESLPDAAIVFNEDKTLVWCNSLAQAMLGFKWPEDRGNRIDNFLRSPEFLSYLNAKNYDEPFEFTSPVDEHVILECRIAPFEKDKWTLICRDITALKQLEQMRKDFVANVSHELRTPLTVMRGYLEVLGDGDIPSTPIWQKAHKMMTEQTVRMDALVNQLLTLTKLENQQYTVGAGQVDVKSLLTTVKNEAESLSAGKHNISLSVESGLGILGESEQLRSAFSNLVFNAVRYTPEGGQIDIECKKKSDGSIVFSVKDTGDGIPAEHLSRLTERFYRVEQARTRDSGGSGLGLSIVKHVLSNYDSELKIKSEVTKGSKFSFVIDEQFTCEIED
ncbi:MAG: phosphate regulon sensor histidine kinase PhoR [Gammaproteobacteria bacterium]|nr:phosphate regulon sensor histidine kinase PhoR [Gammaproteobacteria bacterium]